MGYILRPIPKITAFTASGEFPSNMEPRICWICKRSDVPLYDMVDEISLLHNWAARSNSKYIPVAGVVCSEECSILLTISGNVFCTPTSGKSRTGTFTKTRKCLCGQVHEFVNEYGYS